MPKLENFATHIKIDGNPFAKNAINYQIQNNDSIGIYYTNDRDRRNVLKSFFRFDDWTDLNDNPYISFNALTTDLDNFLFPNNPLEVTPQESFTLGSLIIPFSDVGNVRRMEAELDGTSTNDFTTFITISGEYSVPANIIYTVSVMSFASNAKLSISMGYADDATGTNFVELIDETVMTPENNYSNETEFIFIIPANKFPIVNNTANITSGFVILQGLQSSADAVAVASDIPDLGEAISIDIQSASRELLKTIHGYEITAGNITDREILHKFGRNDEVGSTQSIISLGGIYRMPQVAGATALRVKAGNVNDAPGGSGARAVVLHGLDETGAEITEIVATGGVSAGPNSTTTFLRLFRSYVAASGTYSNIPNDTQAATIVIENAAGTEDWIIINDMMGQSHVGGFSVPLGKEAVINSWFSTINIAANKAHDLLMFSRENILQTVVPFSAMRDKLHIVGLQSPMIPDFKVPLGPFPALTDILWVATVATGTASVSIDFELEVKEV